MAFNLINFKKGTLAGLNTLKTNSGIEEGTFYLTIDSNKQTSRLFIGTGATTALPVNSNIVVVSSTDDLTSSHAANFNDGDFAYVTDGNILAVRYNGAWTQVNPGPTNATLKYLDSAAYSISTSNGVATITWAGTRSDNQDVTSSMTVTGSNGVTVSGSNAALTISGDPATLASSAISSNATNLTLSSTGSTASGTVAIAGGTNVTLSGSANSITISATDTNTTNSSLTFGAGNGETGVNASTNGFYVSILDSENNDVKDDIDPVISILTNEAGTTTSSVHFVNGIAALDVYSKDEINRRLKAIDGMTYKGTVGTGGSAATSVSGISNPAIGDTFKVISDLSNIPTSGNGTGTAKNGDLLIANGTESNGVITAGSLYYDIIPAGDDTNQTYSVTSDTNGIKIHDNVANNDIGGIKLVAGNDISISESGTTSKAITVSHETMSSAVDGNPTTGSLTAGNTQGNCGDLTINAVTGLTTDNGHVTAVAVTPFKVVDTNASLTSLTDSVTAGTGNDAGKKATITTQAVLTHSNNSTVDTKSDSYTLNSDNLSISVSGKDITMNLVWGSF